MNVRPDPLILGKEFADERGGTESHSDGYPGSIQYGVRPLPTDIAQKRPDPLCRGEQLPQLVYRPDPPRAAHPHQIPKGSGYTIVV